MEGGIWGENQYGQVRGRSQPDRGQMEEDRQGGGWRRRGETDPHMDSLDQGARWEPS